MNQYWKHFKVIIKHKWYVAIECFKAGLYWQGLVHDLSKFTPTEFFISAKYFTGKSSPIDKERIEKGYSIVWLNHKAKNKHHFHYWVDIDRDKCVPVDMPDKYILEMACDFIGAGKAYNNVTNDRRDPLKYYKEKINKELMTEITKKKFENVLTNYASYGKVELNI